MNAMALSDACLSFEIRPNCSVTRLGAAAVFVAIFSVSVGISAYFASLGAWMVLPFAGLELLLLGAAICCFMRNAQHCETVSVTDAELRVVKRGNWGVRDWVFQPYWAQIILRRDPRYWYPSQLVIRSHGREVRIGDCLTEQERTRLARELRACVGAAT
jgi:uncharacterized membrane protein